MDIRAPAAGSHSCGSHPADRQKRENPNREGPLPHLRPIIHESRSGFFGFFCVGVY